MTSPDTERECTTTRAKLLVAHAFFFPRFSHFSSLLLPNLFSGLSGSGTWQLMPPAITLTHGAMYVTSSAYARMPVLHSVFCVCVCFVRVVCALCVCLWWASCAWLHCKVHSCCLSAIFQALARFLWMECFQGQPLDRDMGERWAPSLS